MIEKSIKVVPKLAPASQLDSDVGLSQREGWLIQNMDYVGMPTPPPPHVSSHSPLG